MLHAALTSESTRYFSIAQSPLCNPPADDPPPLPFGGGGQRQILHYLAFYFLLLLECPNQPAPGIAFPGSWLLDQTLDVPNPFVMCGPAGFGPFLVGFRQICCQTQHTSCFHKHAELLVTTCLSCIGRKPSNLSTCVSSTTLHFL